MGLLEMGRELCGRASTEPLLKRLAPARSLPTQASLLVLALMAVAGGEARAESAGAGREAAAGAATDLDEITVTAERRPTTVKDVSATVSVKTADDLQRKLVTRPADLVADEPGVSVGNAPTRAGAGSYTIRGIGDNRVLVEEDGIRVQDYPESQKGPGLYTRDFVDFDNLKQVEIVRGPASALRGSEAIGGVVSFVTKDPEDFLKLMGKDWYLGLKAAYDSSDRTLSETATVAGRSGAWSAFVTYGRRDGEELRPNTSAVYNDQIHQRNDIFGKIVWDASEAGRFRFTFERFDRRDWTNLKTDLGPSVLASTAEDTTRRSRVNLDWTRPLDTSFADLVEAKVYWSGLDRAETNPQTRLQTGVIRYRTTTADYKQDLFGGDVQFSLNRDFWGASHAIVYGVSASLTETSRLRDRWEINAATRAITRSFSGDTYPNKLFPDTDTTQAAVFAQDTIGLGALRLNPALRLDYWNLSPKADTALRASSSATVYEQTKVALSPKFGATYDLNETFRAVAQYSHGFRAPPYDSANFAYTNAAFGYQILPNGSLKPETSDGFEAGLRAGFSDGSSARLTGFYNRYRDFIDTAIVGRSSSGLIQYQYVNVANAAIWGAEARGEWKINPAWSVNGSIAYAIGENLDTKKALDSVDPVTGVLGVAWRPDEAWTLEGRMRAASGKTRVSDPTIYKPAGWTTFDAFATYELKPQFTLSAGVFNIFDKKYFSAQDVSGQLASNTLLETYRAPGRSFAVSATLRF